jgi:hypothetical protein
MTDTIDRAQTIRGLRELADFLETHQGVPITAHRLNEFADTRDEWDVIQNAAPWTAALTTDDFLVLRRTFAGGIVLEVNVERPRVEDDTIDNAVSRS